MKRLCSMPNNISLLFLFVLFTSCASQKINKQELLNKNLPGYYQPSNGSQFNYMDIKCDGRFIFKTYDHEDKGVRIHKIDSMSFETTPQLLGHYYKVLQWPNAANKYQIRLQYVLDSLLNKYSGSLNRLESERSQEIYKFIKTKNYNCQ